MFDLFCVLATIAAGIALVLRYGSGIQAGVYIAEVVLLMVGGLFDRKAQAVPGVIPVILTLLWLGSIWWMPYGVGPQWTAPGAEGLVPFFAAKIGIGALPVFFDGVIGALVVLAVCGLLVLVVGIATGQEAFRRGSVPLFAAAALYVGTMGSAFLWALTVGAALVIVILFHLAARTGGGMLSSSLFYTGTYGQFDSRGVEPVPLALALGFAQMVLYLFF